VSGPVHESAAGTAPAGPLPRTPTVLDDALVIDVLSRLAGAASQVAAVEAVLPLLLDLPGVRATAVLLRDAGSAVVVGSAGYDCGTMAAGAALPLDAGLPVTEAVRTGRTVVQGSGPSWVAVPFGGRTGAVLLSLTTPPPQAPTEQARLQRIARALGDALQRSGQQERTAAALEVVATRSAPPAVEGALLRSLPYDGPVGGDLALCVPDGRGGRWAVVADVCGAGLPAAVVARSVHAALAAALPYVDGPAALLSAADRALRAALEPGLFVTALVVHMRAGLLHVASAGHPPPLVLSARGARVVEVEPGVPLALEAAPATAPAELSLSLSGDEVLLLHSDGLVDRRRSDGPVTADPLALVAGAPLHDLAALADHVLAAAARVGAAGDDVTLLLVPPN